MPRISSALTITAVCFAPGLALAQVDFEPITMQIDATSASPSIIATVRNAPGSVGTIAAGQDVRFYDGTPGAGGTTVLGTLQTTQALAPGAQQTLTFPLAANYGFTLANGVARMMSVRTDPDATLAESNETNNDNFAYRWREGLNPPVPRQHRVLVININGTNYNAEGTRLRDTVIFAGGAVTYQNLSAQNQVASLIAANTFDQIWIFDLSHTTDPYANDWQAIADWFNTDNSRDIIADGRIIATIWNGQNLIQGRPISDNYYENLRIRGGGLMLGTDHGGGTGPTNGTGVYVTGINSVNDRIGIGRFWGNPGGNIAGMPPTDPNPLRNIPNNIAFNNGGTLGVRSDSSPGNCPTGFQDSSNIAPGFTPIGRTLFTLAWHNGTNGGGASTPAISTTIAGTLGFSVTIDGCRAPATSASSIMTAQVSAGAVPPLTYQWRSNVQGIVGTNSTFDTASLNAGVHTLTVVVTDQSGFRPGTSVRVVVGGADCNNNCIPDDEDISSGLLADTNPTNGIPDVCEDQDGDGAPDMFDVAPCDARIVAEGFAPAQNSRGMFVVEDQWPYTSDLDFNDIVVAHHYQTLLAPNGNTVIVRATFDVLAIGGDYTMGFGMSLPVPSAQVASVSRMINGGAAQGLTLRPQGTRSVVWVSADLRELFGFAQGPINSIPGGQSGAVAQIAVDLTFLAGTSLPLSQAPFDLYGFHSLTTNHEIHGVSYSGTSEMDTSLFGRGVDNSGGSRWFVDHQGLPYALDFPALILWPAESQPISSVYPDIVPWAASGGTTNQNFWQTNVNPAPAYTPAPPPMSVTGYPIDRSCLP